MSQEFSSPIPTLTRSARGLLIEQVALADVAARFGTPVYVYSRAALTDAFDAYRRALGERRALVCCAVKANSNLGVLSVFAQLGAGFDIVSGGELARVLAAGGRADSVVFSGVGKSRAEMHQALEARIRCFNVESATELERLNEVAAQMDRTAPVALRVNPDVDPKTHPYISTGLRGNKFGVAFVDAKTLYRRAAALPHLRVCGIACHIGSQLLDSAPMVEAARRVLGLIDQLAGEGIHLEHVDLGGGLGIRYRDESPPTVDAYLAPLLKLFEGRPEELCFEPGRSLTGNAGLLLTRVEYLKRGEEKNFAIVDAAMNDLLRPSLYDGWHAAVEVAARDVPKCTVDVVGPICESGDFLARNRDLAVEEGDLLALLSAGAYGMSMSSNYNSRPRAAEVLVDGQAVHLVRARETMESLYALECALPSSQP
ncbi:MAG: diaminopimelate decarboxylase [Betaproteobacteria bacterium]|nr:diaminopimelate decarboxylase [Betaproteobacteria bacterium]